MIYSDGKIRHFTDLEGWKQSHQSALDIYKVTKLFPKEELFGLTNQMRRAAVSVGSNIAEGFSRNTAKDKSQFYSVARGSATELESQLLLARDIGYLNEEVFDMTRERLNTVGKLVTGLLKYLQKQ
jgi:four helix bundle protein